MWLLLGAMLSFGCGSAELAPETDERSAGGSAGNAPAKEPSAGSGSQTGSASTAACQRVSIANVDEGQARAAGFPVDENRAIFEHPAELPFHRGDHDCSRGAASVDGTMQVRARLLGLEYETLEPTFPEASESCPEAHRHLLWYDVAVDLQASDEALVGSFRGRGATWRSADQSYDGLVVTGKAPAADFSGSLGARVDRGREHEAVLLLSVALGAPVFHSQVFVAVHYADGKAPESDEGDGLFWPANTQQTSVCGWLSSASSQNPVVALDDYNGAD